MGATTEPKHSTTSQSRDAQPEPRFNPRYRYRALCLVSLRWRLSDVGTVYCCGITPEPANKHVTFEAVVEYGYPRCPLFEGFLPRDPVDGVTAMLPCPVPWMPQSSSTMGQTQLCQPGRAGVPCVDHADAMHTDD